MKKWTEKTLSERKETAIELFSFWSSELQERFDEEINWATMPFGFNDKKRTLGTAWSWPQARIELSTWFFDLGETELENTIVHEILHCFEDCNGHRGEWRRKADIVEEEYGIIITRTSQAANEAMTEKLERSYKYTFECEGCGQFIGRFKKSRFVKEYKSYRCGGCKGRFRRTK